MLEWIVYIAHGQVFVDKAESGVRHLDRYEISNHGQDDNAAKLVAYRLASRGGLPIANMMVDPDTD